jgi:hypothetical protein
LRNFNGQAKHILTGEPIYEHRSGNPCNFDSNSDGVETLIFARAALISK